MTRFQNSEVFETSEFSTQLPREFLYELHKHFSGDIRTDSASRILYSTDASMYQIEPLGVVIPRNQEELHAAVELAAKYKIPILPRGAGTSLAGQAIGEALILDCSRWLDKILEINLEEKFAIVEPGVVLSNLNKAASKHGLMFGPDPASAERATMGGVIANNGTGAHSIVYGMSADHILEADVILGDGLLTRWGELSDDERGKMKEGGFQENVIRAVIEIREKYAEAIKRNYPKTWRNAAGYRLNYLLPWAASTPPRWEGMYPPVSSLNLAPLLAGSEGTLAVIRKLKVNLVSKPRNTILAVLSYASVAEACDDVPRLLRHAPSAIELIPNTILRAARSSVGYASEASWIAGDPAALLVVEFSGDDAYPLKTNANNLTTAQNASTTVFASAPLRSDLRSARNSEKIYIAESKEEQARIWNVRKMGLGLLDSQSRSARPIAFIEDCAIPVERLGEFVREVEKILSAHGAEGGIYAHASAGCLHIRPVLDLKTSRGVETLRSISEAVLFLTSSLGGAMSSEHGDGLARSEHLARAYGAEVMDAMRLLKNAADPNRILNPGKIIDPQKMDANLRYGVDYKTKAWKPNLSFARRGGFELVVEQCNGQGVCRKSTGVMCPSFQATRDEMHSTRGRANLLRAMITSYELRDTQYALRSTSYSVLRNDELTESTFQALDLCLACKGCKAECPSGVDMAKLKYEFENEYYKTHRRPLRDYVFGYFHVAAKMMSYVAPVANGLMEFAPTKKLIAKMLGLAEERELPKVVKRRQGNKYTGRQVLATEIAEKSERKKIIFSPDVFSRYIEPQVEEAALEVLTMCGYDVQVLPIVGAGASLLSKGFVDAARRHAREMLKWLNQFDPSREAVVVGVEPPEIYLLKNDYVDLLPESAEEIRARESKVWLVDEFLLRSSSFDAVRVARWGEQNASLETKQENDDSGLLRGAESATRNDRLYFHPHCHQRAEGMSADGIASGANASVELLRACGFDVELSDAGCCGMAGTFGFEAEHYEVSMRIAELKLLPALRALNREGAKNAKNLGDKVVSTGAACRMQVRHGSGLEARHPIEWVREWLLRT